jgi:D-cysteine desulfhydrase
LSVGDELPDGARAWLGSRALPWARIGRWPTPLTALARSVTASAAADDVWIKREDLSHPRYGGNKLRTLEVLLGAAAARGVTRVWATGAYGSNHAVATLAHAEAAGLRAGALLFPQPYSEPAAANLRAVLRLGGPVLPVANVATLPLAMALGWQRDRRRGERPWMMAPGGASPLGALGALSAVFELAAQLRAGAAPPPACIVVAAGSTCTSAGLLAGLALAEHLGAWPWPRPLLRAVRVTPWPVTSHYRVSWMAHRALELADRLRGDRSGIRRAQLASHLLIDGEQLGPGYGHSTPAGAAAARHFTDLGGPALDSVYAAKAAAAMLAAMTRQPARRPMLFWSTKSAALPALDGGDPSGPVPPPFARWLARGAP